MVYSSLFERDAGRGYAVVPLRSGTHKHRAAVAARKPSTASYKHDRAAYGPCVSRDTRKIRERRSDGCSYPRPA